MPTKSSKVKAKPGLNKKQLTHLEKRLLEERARVIKELGHYGESFNSSLQASDGDLSSYSFHMADQGTDAMEREKQFLFASQEGRYLWHVNEALRRLYKAPEKFGRGVRGVVVFGAVDVGAWRGPTFNVADSAVTIGAIALGLPLWQEGRAQQRAKEARAAEPS